MDVIDRKTRSKIMAAIRSSGNRSTELVVERLLRQRRLRGWRRQFSVEGRPDFAWPGLKIALFVDGCFWHGCSLCYRPAKSNVEFWKGKVERNRARDKRVSRHLRSRGWTVLRVRECQVSRHATACRIERAYSRAMRSAAYEGVE